MLINIKAFEQNLLDSSAHNKFSNPSNWCTGQWTTKEMAYYDKVIGVTMTMSSSKQDTLQA
eukprot:15338218-Ditylum_brightwellii.AAC.1